jgi:hypothetical protein
MRLSAIAIAFGVSLTLVIACGDDDSPPPSSATPEHAGQSCTAPAQCYAGVDGGSIRGEVQCLTRVPGGYCTHLCESDADCCAVPGECKSGLKQVCSPFESTGQKMCFLSCEAGDLRPAPDGGTLDDNAFCVTYATTGFSCRSSGGGRQNRKVCVP